jgi:Tol biopolymer transport system component
MNSVARLLDREAATVDLEPGDFERLLRRRDDKRRNERIRAGALAVLVLIVTAFGLARALDTEDRTTAIDPTPTLVGNGELGALAYALDGDIVVADWDGQNPVTIADGRPGGAVGCGSYGYWAEGHMWSPDGRYLAYRGGVCEGIPSVFISDPEGNLVTSFPGEGWLISWSPDSTRVAAWVRWGKTIGVYGLDGERQTLLTLPSGLMAPGDWDPVWTPDGAALMVPHGVRIPLDGSTPRKLPADDPRTGVMSPDGARVVYDRGALLVGNADGSAARVLSPGCVHGIVWSPTGDRIAYSYRPCAADGYDTELRVIEVATGTVTRLAGMAGTESVRALDFSPDGDRILFSRVDTSGRERSLWTVDADGSDLRRLVSGSYWADWQVVRPTG